MRGRYLNTVQAKKTRMKPEGFSATNGTERISFDKRSDGGDGQKQRGSPLSGSQSTDNMLSLSDANTSGGQAGSDGISTGNKSRYRGVSYDRKKAKWRVQIKVAALGKSGVSVGYFDTEEAAARAYDRAAIGLLGRGAPNLQTNFHQSDYSADSIPMLSGKSREEVKTTLKSERIKQAPRRRFMSRQRTSQFMGVGSSNRKNQWQARILVHGKVTHLGYYETEEEAAKVYDRVSLALHGMQAQTNFVVSDYREDEIAPFRGLDRENLQRALGVKPMDKSSKYRGVSKKKGKWEAKVMVNRRWAYRELFDSEEAAARAYDRALWRLKPCEAQSYVNFKDEMPGTMAVGNFDGTHHDTSPDGSHMLLHDEDDSDGDFEYEYKPSKGTSRSDKMRAKKNASCGNLHEMSKSKPSAVKTSKASFSIVPGEGMKFTAGTSMESATTPLGMIPNHSSNSFEQNELLIRVGSETHLLPPSNVGFDSGSNTNLMKKHSGLKRATSEPQFIHFLEETAVPGTMEEINDLMSDTSVFKGVDLGLLTGSAGQPEDHDLLHIHDFVSKSGVDMHDSMSLFEDEELALTSLDHQPKPRKLNKSISMQNLSCLDVSSAAAVSSGTTKPPLLPHGGTLQQSGGLKPGLRRINTYTSSLPSLDEEHTSCGLAKSHNSSDEDLIKQLWGSNMNTSYLVDDVKAYH